MKSRLNVVGNICGKGLLVGKEPEDVKDVDKVIRQSREKRIHCQQKRRYGGRISFASPLSLWEQDLSFMVKVLKESLCRL